MQVFRGLSELPSGFGPTVATIGNFDGVHRGHQWMIAQVIGRARDLAARAVAITFDPHPSRALRPEHPHPLLTPLPQKLDLLARTGLDATLVLPFTPDLARTSARGFCLEILLGALGVVGLFEGENFRLGHKAEGDQAMMEALGRELGFSTTFLPPLRLRAAAVSSSRIRQMLSTGRVSQARALLGRPFAIQGTPAPGRGYGTRYAVSTVNLAPYPELLPANGVYVTWLTVAGEIFEAVTNIGNRPTFGADSFAVESHLLNFHPISLDQSTPLQLEFLHHLRPERQWPSPEALRAQIGLDVRKAQRFFRLCQLRKIIR